MQLKRLYCMFQYSQKIPGLLCLFAGLNSLVKFSDYISGWVYTNNNDDKEEEEL